jgi:hypothetical protein
VQRRNSLSAATASVNAADATAPDGTRRAAPNPKRRAPTKVSLAPRALPLAFAAATATSGERWVRGCNVPRQPLSQANELSLPRRRVRRRSASLCPTACSASQSPRIARWQGPRPVRFARLPVWPSARSACARRQPPRAATSARPRRDTAIVATSDVTFRRRWSRAAGFSRPPPGHGVPKRRRDARDRRRRRGCRSSCRRRWSPHWRAPEPTRRRQAPLRFPGGERRRCVPLR